MKMSRILQSDGCCFVVTSWDRGFWLVRAERIAYFIAVPGPKANKGTVNPTAEGRKERSHAVDDLSFRIRPTRTGRLSIRWKRIPVDKLKTKAFIGTNYKKEIVLPSYVKNVKKVVIWFASRR